MIAASKPKGYGAISLEMTNVHCRNSGEASKAVRAALQALGTWQQKMSAGRYNREVLGLAVQGERRRVPPPRPNFLINWFQGAWAEERVIEAINQPDSLWFALRYGPSRGDISDYDRLKNYLQQLDEAMHRYGKRPDVLVFCRKDIEEGHVDRSLDLQELENDQLKSVIERAVVALEVRSSLWSVREAKDAGKELSFTLKEEDIEPVCLWMRTHCKPVFYVQVFYDAIYGIPFQKLVEEARNRKKAKKFPKTGKLTYTVPLSVGIKFAVAKEEPKLEPGLWRHKGNIIPYVRFKGGEFKLTDEFSKEMSRLWKP